MAGCCAPIPLYLGNLTDTEMKINSIIYVIAFSGLLLNSCGSASKPVEEVLVQRTVFQHSPIDSIYSGLRPAIEKFEINPEQTQEIEAQNGTKILIPANSFVDGFGNAVSGNVELEIIEVNELVDFLACGLQTLSDNRLLESAGMIFVDAKNEGKSLRIAEDRKISISMPMMKKGQGFNMFSGEFDKQGKLNWTEDESAEKDYLISFPADVLYGKDGYWSRGLRLGYWLADLDTINYDPRNEKYTNTIIQTREFRDRLWTLQIATDLISVLLNKDLNWNEYEYEHIKWDDKLYELYFSNHNLDIQVLDSIANSIVNDFLKKPEFREWNESLTDEKRHPYWWGSGFDEEKNKPWVVFGLDGAKGNVPKFETHGVDLLSENAFDQLVSKGATEDEAHTIINIEKERTAFINESLRIKELRERKEKIQEFVQETVFSTSELGWINCDRFIDDPQAGKAEILVSIPAELELDYTDCSLIIPSMNVRLGAYSKGSNVYTFTNEDGVYSKLPIGQDAIIIGVAVKDGNCYFAFEKIKIEDDTSVTLNMSQLEKESLNSTLDKLLSPA